MFCGASKKKITPPESLTANLRGLGNIIFTQVLDDIFVRALILGDEHEKVLLVVFDLDKAPYPEQYIQELSDLTGIPQASISILSIHTHTAPVTGWRPNEGPNFIMTKPECVQEATKAYEALVHDAVIEAVKEAAASQQPARIGWSTGQSFVNVNRVQDYFSLGEDGKMEVSCGLGQNFTAETDHGLFVLKAERLDGTPIACLINYAVHNCVLIGNRCGKNGGALLSSDLGGNVSQMIERNNPGCVALWTSGAAGDVNPIMSNEIFYPDPETGRQTAYLLPSGETAPVMMMRVLAARHHADVKRVLGEITCGCGEAQVGGSVDWSKTPGTDGAPYEIRVHLLKIGPLGLWGFSGELYSSLGKALRQTLQPGTHIILNHDASLIASTGYIFDDETLARDTQAVLPGHRHSAMQPGYVEKSLTSTAAAMWAELSTENH